METNKKKAIEIRYLNEEDMIRAGVEDMDRCISTMEDTFRLLECGDYRMGGENANEHGIKVLFPDESNIEGMPINEPDKRFMAMPAYLGGQYHMFGIKCYGSNPRNREKELPRSILMMTLMDVETGAPKAYMSANIMSAMRTAATVGVGVKYLANLTSRCVAIIGPGVMGRYSLNAIAECIPGIDTVRIKGRSEKSLISFIDYCKEKFPQIKQYIICESIEEACENADVVCVTTTNAARYEDNPTIMNKWLKKGALVISVSSLLIDKDIMMEQNCVLVADNYSMYEEWGKGHAGQAQRKVSTLLGMGYYDAVTEGLIKKENIRNLGSIVTGKVSGRDFSEQIVLLAVGGMPIEDVSWGYECYLSAKQKNIGTVLTLWDKSRLV